MKQTEIKAGTCETCERSRRLGGSYYQGRRVPPQSPEPLIPCLVLLCTFKPGIAICPDCHRAHEAAMFSAVECCGHKLRVHPAHFVNPWQTCRGYLPVSLA